MSYVLLKKIPIGVQKMVQSYLPNYRKNYDRCIHRMKTTMLLRSIYSCDLIFFPYTMNIHKNICVNDRRHNTINQFTGMLFRYYSFDRVRERRTKLKDRLFDEYRGIRS